MPAPQIVVVSPRGSGTPLLARVVADLGYTPYGTMSGAWAPAGGERPGPGEVFPLLAAAHGQQRAARLLRGDQATLSIAFQDTVSALWRVWWRRLGQPVTAVSPVAAELESRLTQVPDAQLSRLLPGRGCWFVNALDLRLVDGGFLRSWQAGEQPPIIFHHRDVRDRVISQIHALSQPADRVGSIPEHLVYRDILAALPTMEARITQALTDPDFPGLEETRRCRWLAHHPAVCTVAHEDLAGPALGGTFAARAQALARLLAATGHQAPNGTAPAPPVHDDDAASDDLAVGAWRRHFTSDHEQLLHRLHPDLLAGPASPPAPDTAVRTAF